MRGRCLSYGEGISYWPVTEVVKQLGRRTAAPSGPLASILGDDSAASSPEEIAWAFRKLLESHAAEQPLIVCSTTRTGASRRSSISSSTSPT